MANLDVIDSMKKLASIVTEPVRTKLSVLSQTFFSYIMVRGGIASIVYR